MNGVLDPTSTLAQFKSEAGPLLKTIQNELQKQINAFLKK
jgi:putative aldouronate transport system substrate-binding protein